MEKPRQLANDHLINHNPVTYPEYFPDQRIEHAITSRDFLVNLSPSALTALMANAKTVQYAKQTLITSDGDPESAFFILNTGKVRIYVCDEAGKEITLDIHEAGTYFGEMSLFSDSANSFNTITLKKTVCSVVCKHDFLQWLQIYPEASFLLLGVLSARIKHISIKIKQLALLNNYERTVNILESLANWHDNERVIDELPSQQELAYLVGTTRETVNKIMRELCKSGYIKQKNKMLFINKKPPTKWKYITSSVYKSEPWFG